MKSLSKLLDDLERLENLNHELNRIKRPEKNTVIYNETSPGIFTPAKNQLLAKAREIADFIDRFSR